VLDEWFQDFNIEEWQDDRWILKDLQEIDGALTELLSPEFTWSDWGKPRKEESR
jgi:hypothetical protein